MSEEGTPLSPSDHPLELMCRLLELSCCDNAEVAEWGRVSYVSGDCIGGEWMSTPQSGSASERSGQPQFGSSLDLFGSTSVSAETVSLEAAGNLPLVNTSESDADSLGKRQGSSLDLFASSSEHTMSGSTNTSIPKKRVISILSDGLIPKEVYNRAQEQEEDMTPFQKPGTFSARRETYEHASGPSQLSDVLDMFKIYSGSETLECDPASCYRMGGIFRMVAHWGRLDGGGGCITRAKWSPDGVCLLSSSQDRKTRLFRLPAELHYGIVKQLPEMSPTLTLTHGEPTYDFSWYPRMDSHNPSSCCFATCSKDHPVQLWDASLGCVRCCYYSYNHKGLLVSPSSLEFSADGERLYCGLNSCIKTFSTSLPGRCGLTRSLRSFGAVSCIAVHPTIHGVSALGSRTGNVLLYADNAKIPVGVVPVDHNGGITHALFSPSGLTLYTGYRSTPWLHCWDLRQPDRPLHIMEREASTTQPVYFDLFSGGRYIITGETDEGVITGWDLHQPRILPRSCMGCLRPHFSFTAHVATVTACSVHPSLPLLATAVCGRPQPQTGSPSHPYFRDDWAIKVWSLLGKRAGSYEELLGSEPRQF